MPFLRSRLAAPRAIPTKKLALFIGGPLAALVVLYVVAAAMVDAEKLQGLAQAHIKALTGRELTVKGGASASLLPHPHLTLTNVELAPAAEAPAGAPVLRAAQLKVDVAWGSALGSVPSIEKLSLIDPVLEVQKKTDGTMEWDWLATLGAALQGATDGGFAIDLRGGKVAYLNAATEFTERVENINLTYAPAPGGVSTANGGLTYRGQNVQFGGQMGAPREDGGAEVTFRFWQSENTFLEFKGERVTEEQIAHLRGALSAKIEDIAAWSPPPVEAPAEPPPAYNVSLAGTMDWAGNTISLADITMETPDSAATGKALAVFALTPQFSADLAFSRLKLDPKLLASFFTVPVSALAGAPASYIEASATTLPKNIDVNLALTAQEVFLGTYHIPGATFSGRLKDAALQIDRLSAVLPGESQMTLTGAVTDTTRGPRFQGVAETSGKNLRMLLATMEPSAQQLPEKGMGEFSVKGNFFFSSEQLRLSEAEVKLEDLALNGGLVTYFEATPRVEAEIMLSGTNLDYFRNSWRTESAAAGEFIFKINSNVDFSWLRQLRPIIDLRLTLNQFTFLDREGSSAAFRLYAKQNEFGVYNLEMNYPDGMLKAKFKVNVTNETPLIELEAEMPWFDTAYFSKNPGEARTPLVTADTPEKRWSKELFDLGWMIGVSSQFNFNINSVTHHGERFDKFMMEGTLGNEQLQFKKLSFERFGGRIEATGTLVGGKVPGLTTSFTAYNVDLAEIIRIFSTVNKLTGRASLSGTIVTSGIHFASWVEQADVKLVMAGRGIRVSGFNLQGVIDGVNAARSVADVVENVSRSLPSGTTEFSVDGNINISKGMMRTPGMALSAGRVAASLNGELQLMTWKMALNMLFQFPMLQSETVPTLTVDVVGTPEDYLFKFDTSSLEAYVAKRIVGR